MIRFFDRGREFYQFLYECIRAAESEVLIAVYSFHDDSVGRKFVSLLEEKARAGVRVKVLFDGVGSWGDQQWIVKRITAAGGEARIFRPRRWYLWKRPVSFLYRNHARIFLIDRALLGFGGMCIGKIYEDREDLSAFLSVTDAEKLVRYFEKLWALGRKYGSLAAIQNGLESFEVAEGVSALISGPRREEEKIYDWALRECRAAKRSITIVTSWFLPTRELVKELIAAQMRGVRVVIVTPRATDQPGYDSFRALSIPTMLKQGVVWYGTRNYFHQKYFIIDDAWCFGSANFDIISMKRNYELNIAGRGGAMLAEFEKRTRALMADIKPRQSHPSPFLVRKIGFVLYAAAEFFMTAGIRMN